MLIFIYFDGCATLTTTTWCLTRVTIRRSSFAFAFFSWHFFSLIINRLIMKPIKQLLPRTKYANEGIKAFNKMIHTTNITDLLNWLINKKHVKKEHMHRWKVATSWLFIIYTINIKIFRINIILNICNHLFNKQKLPLR